MAFAKKTQKESKIEYVKLSDVSDGASYIKNGEMWLKSGKYPAPGVSIPIDEKTTLSDWLRHITMEDVTVIVTMRKAKDGKEYPELTIKGGECTDLPF